MRVSAQPSPTLISTVLILWQLICIMLISQNFYMRTIGPGVDLDLDWNMRVISLLIFDPTMKFPVQDRTSESFFAVL